MNSDSWQLIGVIVFTIVMIAVIGFVSIENHKQAEQRWERNNALFQDCLRRQQNKDIDLFCSQYDPERIELERRKVNAIEYDAYQIRHTNNRRY
jgi:hypothetical protein